MGLQLRAITHASHSDPRIREIPWIKLLLFRVKGEPAKQGLKGTFKWLQESDKKSRSE